jgi:hypothetical protein
MEFMYCGEGYAYNLPTVRATQHVAVTPLGPILTVAVAEHCFFVEQTNKYQSKP